jgi:hypothetical protein
MRPTEYPTIHYTELPPGPPNKPPDVEWECYRREVGRLLAEGHEGRWVLIKGEEIIGLFDTREAAMAEGYKRYLIPRERFLVHPIQEWERLYRISWRLMAESCHTSP